MNLNSQQIERITQGVLQELRSRGVIVSASATNVDPVSESVVVRDECAVPAGQVITEDCLVQLSAAGRTLAVPSSAVITPSGRDYIRKHRISVKRGTAASVPATGVLFTIGDCPSAASAANVAGWQTKAADCEWDAARLTLAEIQHDRRVVCCGGQPAVVSCLLNRDQTCRAAVITPDTARRHLIELMNPQIWCLASKGWSFAELLNLLRGTGQAGTEAPTGWNEAGGRR